MTAVRNIVDDCSSRIAENCHARFHGRGCPGGEVSLSNGANSGLNITVNILVITNMLLSQSNDFEIDDIKA